MNNYKYYFFGNLVSSLMPFILMPLITRYLVPEEYGKLSIFLLILTALNSILGFSVHKFIFRKTLEIAKKEVEKYLFNALILLGVTFSIYAIFVFLLYLLSWDFINNIGISREHIIYCGVLSLCSFLIEIRLSIWQASEKPKKYIFLQMVRALANFIFAVIFVIFLNGGYEGRVEGYMFSYSVIAILSLYSLYLDGYIRKNKVDKKVIFESLKFGLPLVPTALTSILILFAERLVISNVSSMDKVGIYVIALQISTVVTIIFDSVHKQYSVQLIKLLDTGERYNKAKAVKVTLFVFVLALLCYFISVFISPAFVIWFLGDEYSLVSTIINVIVLGTTMKGMTNTLFYFFYQSGKTKSIFNINIIYMTFHLVLIYPFVINFELLGASYLYLISNLVQLFITLFIVIKQFNIPCVSLFSVSYK